MKYRLSGLLMVALAGLSLVVPVRAEINLLDNDRLIEAVNSNDLEGAEALLNRKHFADVVDAKQRTPLIIAAARGYEDLVDVLIRFRASVDAVDELGNSALFYAAAGDHTGVIEILKDAGANVNIKNRRGGTPLMVAAAGGRTAAVQMLLDFGARAGETDFTGRTARDWAQSNNRRTILNVFDRRGIKR